LRQCLSRNHGEGSRLFDVIMGLPRRRAQGEQLPHIGTNTHRNASFDRNLKDLVKRGFKFVGPTIVYAFMEATGMVNDHLMSCHRYAACAALATKSAKRPHT
jgi:DNA-3-methyladenine glycosylase I